MLIGCALRPVLSILKPCKLLTTYLKVGHFSRLDRLTLYIFLKCSASSIIVIIVLDLFPA